jgi:hypothetical protein
MLTVALLLLVLGVIVGSWCLFTGLYGRPRRVEVRFGCIGAVLLIGGAMCFAFAAAMETGL